MTLFTIGYEGLDLTAFTALLARHGVETVVDVRELPLSRKKGFSKQVLKQALAEAGFGYVHVQALGCPRPVRDQYRQDKNWARYTEGFMAHLGQQQTPVRQVAELAGTTACALLCYEADYNFCHRSMVAEAVSGTEEGFEVVHIRSREDDRNLALF